MGNQGSQLHHTRDGSVPNIVRVLQHSDLLCCNTNVLCCNTNVLCCSVLSCWLFSINMAFRIRIASFTWPSHLIILLFRFAVHNCRRERAVDLSRTVRIFDALRSIPLWAYWALQTPSHEPMA